jgi:Putative MetA-pathway of phenol degradation
MIRSVSVSLAALGVCMLATLSSAQDGFPANWLNIVTATQSEQPHWITPLATTTPRLEQEFRYDLQWQTHNSGLVTENYGVSKGLEIIPEKNVEVIVAVPPYIVNNPDSANGFGDWQFLVKYRIAAANESHGNYILTAFYQMSLPTGQYEQGALNPVITPTLAYGKGFKDFSVQGTLGGSLPTGSTATIGRTIGWNNTLQYRIFKKLWPETEFNFTHYYKGSHNGKMLLYVTPGLVLGRFPVHDRFSFTFGGGYEIAATSFHPTNHIPILSIRFPF